jgi:hypothetical protein
VVVITAVEMPDWEIRAHRVPLIRFDGNTWRVAGKTTADGKVRYELAPWTPADEYVIGREVEYGPEYVAARDQHTRSSRRSSHVTFWLRVISPFIGFLSARTKGRLEARYGVDPVSTTFQSVFLEFLISLGAFALLSIGQMSTALAKAMKTAGIGAEVWLVILLIAGLAIAIDGSVRYGRILKEERPPPGFFEWLVRRAPRA